MATPNQSIHLRDCLRVISLRRRLVLTVFGTVVALVLLGNFLATPQYEGTTKVLIEREDSADLTGRTRPVYDSEFYKTQFQLIKSRAVARRVVEILALPEDYAAITAGRSPVQAAKSAVGSVLHSVRSLFGTPETASSAAERNWKDLAAAAISAKIKVAPVAESHLVTISFTSADPIFAAKVANTAAKAFIEETLDMKVEASRRNMGWMADKAQSERKNLEKAEQALQDYMQANGIVTLENRITVTPEKLSELSSQLVRAEARRKELEALYAKVARVENNPRAAETVTAIAADPTLQILRIQIAETEKQVMELTNKFGPKHPVMAKTAGDLSVLQEKRQQEIRRIVQTIRNDYELALTNEQSLRAQLNSTKSETLNLNERFIRYGALKREVDTIRQTYDALMLKLREQGITGETQPINLWIVEEATVPLEPSRPRKGLNFLLGLVLGLTAGVGLAFVLDYFDNRITDPDETEELLGVPVLSVIPLSPADSRNVEEIVLKQPLSAVAENYKRLRSALLLSPNKTTARRILVTSAVMGEGKTTTAANLAIALAQTEKKVVLIDGDLRKPRVHKIFKTANEVGLSSYLAGGSADPIVQHGPLPNLSLIPAGPLPGNPSELISLRRLPALLDLLGTRYDFIICDSPPLLMVTDATILSRNFDGTLVVSKAQHTTHDMARRAVKQLRDSKVRILGVVINGMDPKRNEYYYGEYHSAAGTKRLATSRAMLVGSVSSKGE